MYASVLKDDIHTLINPQHAAVQRQVIVLGVAPLHVGVEAVIGRAALVLIPQTFLRGLLSFTVDLHDAVGAERQIRVDKDLQAVRRVLQNIVGTAANDDARAFCGKVCDDLVLPLPQDILVGGAEGSIGKRRSEEPTGGIFSCFFDIVRREAGLLRHFLNDLCVIARNTQFFRHLFADGASAAAKLTADGNDSVFHAFCTPSTFNSR